ncbi:hypothetical protein DIU36_22130 [Mucilaginibacter rubeus]|nr:hypothetical protein DIU36_22130 [Mucilaginibacter rubeus]
MPREGCYFCLDTKVTKKSSQQIGFFTAPASAHAFVWPLPCKPGITTGCNYFAPLRPRLANTSAKTCYAPATAQATIVLPAFARSLPADGEGKRFRRSRCKRQERGGKEKREIDIQAVSQLLP